MRKPEKIASAANPLLKDVRKAIARGTLTAGGYCVAETFHLLEEALGSGCEVHAVIAAETALAAAAGLLGERNDVRAIVLPDALMQGLAATETSQGVMALVRPPEWTLDRLFRDRPLLAVLDGVQDPGNAGTIARTAEAFGATGMLFLKGTVNPYNAKTLRASAGSLFRLPFVSGLTAEEACAALRQHGVALYAGVPARTGETARHPEDVNLAASCALAVGSEGHGVSETLRTAACGVSIPTAGVESLNAAVAAGILLYEARRQRSRAL